MTCERINGDVMTFSMAKWVFHEKDQIYILSLILYRTSFDYI